MSTDIESKLYRLTNLSADADAYGSAGDYPNAKRLAAEADKLLVELARDYLQLEGQLAGVRHINGGLWEHIQELEAALAEATRARRVLAKRLAGEHHPRVAETIRRELEGGS